MHKMKGVRGNTPENINTLKIWSPITPTRCTFKRYPNPYPLPLNFSLQIYTDLRNGPESGKKIWNQIIIWRFSSLIVYLVQHRDISHKGGPGEGSFPTATHLIRLAHFLCKKLTVQILSVNLLFSLQSINWQINHISKYFTEQHTLMQFSIHRC